MSTRRRPGPIGCFGVSILVAATAMGGEGAGPDPSVRAARERFFERDVRPLLVEKCFSCHSAKKQKGGLRLDSLESILHGGDSGPAVVPGKPAESLLVEAINYQGPEMPPAGKLDPAKIDVLTRWVSLGAPWPARDRNAAHAVGEKASERAARPVDQPGLWSFRPLRRPEVPGVESGSDASPSDWSSNPIDRFILRGLTRNGLAPAPPADRGTLIRRVTFDLTGLPPTPPRSMRSSPMIAPTPTNGS